MKYSYKFIRSYLAEYNSIVGCFNPSYFPALSNGLNNIGGFFNLCKMKFTLEL